MFVEDLLEVIADIAATGDGLDEFLGLHGGRPKRIPARAGTSGFGVVGVLAGNWRYGFVTSIAEQTRQGRALTQKQAETALQLILKLLPKLVSLGAVAEHVATRFIAQPCFRKSCLPTQTIPSEVRHLGGNLLALRFGFDSGIIAKLKALKACAPASPAVFNADLKIWVVPVVTGNIEAVFEILQHADFQMDDTVTRYLLDAIDLHHLPSTAGYDPVAGVLALSVSNNSFLGKWARTVAGGRFA